jgi:hypothetical protein
MPLQHDGRMDVKTNRHGAGTQATKTHTHRWIEASVHRVSEGLVVYKRCLCGRWRVIAPTSGERVAEVG